MKRRGRKSGWFLAVSLGVCALVWMSGGPVGAAEQPIRVPLASLSFPSNVAIMVNIVKDQGFDRKQGIDLDVRAFGAISAMYASKATGESVAGVGGPLVYQKMRLEGAPLRIIATLMDMTNTVVITRDPRVRSLADLKGKTIGADMASSEYQTLSVVAKSKGIIMGKDVTVVPAGPPLARTQLAAERVDAIMIWEPTATLAMRDHPNNRIIWNAKQGWREMTGRDGWLLVLGAHDGLIREKPEVIPRLVAAFQDGVRFLRSNPDEADRIVVRTLNLPAGAFKEMVLAPRVVFDVRPTTDPAVSDSIWELIRVAAGEGFFKQPPTDQSVIYTP